MENCCGRRATYYFLLVDPEIISLQQEQTPPCLCVTISNEYIDECITLIYFNSITLIEFTDPETNKT